MAGGGAGAATADPADRHDVWESYESEADARSLVRDGVIGGLRDKELDSLLEKTVERAAAMLQRPEVLTAINALAQALPEAGRMDGKDAAAIIGRAMASCG